jgi:uncharacterized delta-60 repeat protein
MKQIYLAIIACINVLMCLAQAGTLDSTFSGDGFFRVDNKYFTAGAIQADKKFVTAGTGFFFFRAGDFDIYRYTAEGLPDATFGTGGTARATVGGNSGVRQVLIQNDGKILVLGESRVAWSSGSGVIATTVLVRLTTSGQIDETYGDHGMVKIIFGNSSSVYAGEFAMALQQDGKLLVCGPDYTISNNNFSLWRFNTDGSSDNNFGTNGRVTRSYGEHSFSTRVVVQQDGRMVFLGGTTEYVRFVARYLINGTPDATFNGTGIYLHTGQGRYVDALVQPDGKILAAIDLGNSFYMQRINANGTPDNAFGPKGVIESKFSLPVYTTTVDLQENGKIILGGAYAPNPGSYGSGIALARYLPSGSLDNTFGTSGVVMKFLGFNTGGSVIGVTRERIYVLGQGTETFGNHMAYGVLAAFKVAEPPPPCENDTTRPVITCISELNLSLEGSNLYTIPALEAKDNCGVKSVSFSITGATMRNGSGNNASGTFNIGVSYIDWRVADSSNNVTTCRNTVIVRRPSATANVIVPGTSNLWLAGMPDGTPSLYGDVAPANSPVRVNINLNDGKWIEASNVTGGVSHGLFPLVGPDGCHDASECAFEFFIISHEAGAEYGKSNLTAPINSLISVFLDNNTPADPAPLPYDFSTDDSRNYIELHPQLKQTFFIGDGKTATGIQQKIFIPENATRLFVGTMDGTEWNNNNGAFNATISVFGNPVIESCGTNKVAMCHKGKTICIASSAVAAHLAHGDNLGSCDGSVSGKPRGRKGDASVLEQQPGVFRIANAPNPFHNTTTLQYEIPGDGHVMIKVYNVLGTQVATLVNAMQSQGIYTTQFGGTDFTGGVYYYHLIYTTDQHDVFTKVGKMVLIR